MSDFIESDVIESDTETEELEAFDEYKYRYNIVIEELQTKCKKFDRIKFYSKSVIFFYFLKNL